jgi:hypothetical protein
VRSSDGKILDLGEAKTSGEDEDVLRRVGALELVKEEEG